MKDHFASRSNPHYRQSPPYEVICEKCGLQWTFTKKNKECPNCQMEENMKPDPDNNPTFDS